MPTKPPIGDEVDRVQVVAVASSLTLSQTTNVRLFYAERVCRRQF